MAGDAEPNDRPRKTLDDIRRELEAEFASTDVADAGHEADNVARDRRHGDVLVDGRIGDAPDPHDADDARLAQFREMSDRHQLAMGRRSARGERHWRRSDYLMAALVGGVVGQALLLAFFLGVRYGATLDVSRTVASILPGGAVTAALTAVRPATVHPQSSPDPNTEGDQFAAVSPPSSSPVAPSPAAAAKTGESADELPVRVTQETRVSSSRQSTIVSPTTVPERVPPRVTQEPGAASGRPSRVAGASELAESQAALRAALTEWLRSSGRRDAPVWTTDPVIVLGPDARTAKTYVSVTSPVGLVPREQRWELGPRGWSLVDDRQAGLPRPAPASSSR